MNQVKYVKNQRGAALLSALVVSVVLVLLVSVTASVMETRLSLAENSIEQFEGLTKVYQKEQELIYYIATQRKTFAGVSTAKNSAGQARFDGMWLNQLTGDEIRVDGYVNEEVIDDIDVKYSIQAENGLIPVNTSDATWRNLWYRAYELDISDISILEDMLVDYADADEWAKPAGAERAAYKKADKPTPPNYLLQSCDELRNILIWDKVTKQNPSMLGECALSRVARLNLNAVPLSMWRKLWPDSYSTIANARVSGQWITNESEALSVSPNLLQIPPVYMFYKGLNSYIISIEAGGARSTLKVVTQKGLRPPYKLFPVGNMHEELLFTEQTDQ